MTARDQRAHIRCGLVVTIEPMSHFNDLPILADDGAKDVLRDDGVFLVRLDEEPIGLGVENILSRSNLSFTYF